MKTDILPYALVAAGGFSGAVLRFLVDGQVPGLCGTLAVNFLGCVALGIFMYESVYIGKFGRNSRIFFAIGVIGAFTTFSALAVQTFSSSVPVAILNMTASLALGLAGIFIGRHIVSYQRGI